MYIVRASRSAWHNGLVVTRRVKMPLHMMKRVWIEVENSMTGQHYEAWARECQGRDKRCRYKYIVLED